MRDSEGKKAVGKERWGETSKPVAVGGKERPARVRFGRNQIDEQERTRRVLLLDEDVVEA